jgi:hypothetical protein
MQFGTKRCLLLEYLKSVGIESIDVEELVALATISLFNDNHRDAFRDGITLVAGHEQWN